MLENKCSTITTSSQYGNCPAEFCERIFCDMCGIIIEAGRYRAKSSLHLCMDCFYRIDSLGNNIIQSSITRFFSGNVL